MIFTRDVTAWRSGRGGFITSYSKPSMRVANPEQPLVGLDVDIGGAALDGIRENEIDELDDRRVFRFAGEVVDICRLVTLDQLRVFEIQVRDHLIEIAGLVVVEINRGADALLRGDHQLHVVTREELDLVDHDDVRGVGRSPRPGSSPPG